MGVIKQYLIPRFFTFLLVIFLGVTVVFVIPRLLPISPVISSLDRIQANGGQYDAASLSSLMGTLNDLYGVHGSLLEQYTGFLSRSLSGSLGPSTIYYPTPVNQIILDALPWTLGLLLMSTLIAWLIGNLLGGFSGYFSTKKWAKGLGLVATVVYPVPYYIMALLVVLVFSFAIPLFPSYGALSMGTNPSFSLSFIGDYLYHATLPALSLVLVGYGAWFLTMRSLAVQTKSEDYVEFGETMGLPKRKLLLKYVIRNNMLTQITGLVMTVGAVFSGAMVTEVTFSYPGVGMILQQAILSGDYNLLMGIVTYSIIAVALAALVLDLAYPLIDPRIRYK
jgi:ABC-type dipeptide/oligopeptide/nickel transport systems, permease components